jgi:hypothetical protein
MVIKRRTTPWYEDAREDGRHSSKPVKLFLSGDIERWSKYRPLANKYMADMERVMNISALDNLTRNYTLTDGVTIKVQKIFGRKHFHANIPFLEVGGKKEKKKEKDVFLLMEVLGVRMFYGEDWNHMKPVVYTTPYFIIYKLRTNDYAKIVDPVEPTDPETGEPKYVEFPCTIDKISAWTATTTVTSKDWTQYDIINQEYEDYKVFFDPFFLSPETGKSITHADTPASPGGCNCPTRIAPPPAGSQASTCWQYGYPQGFSVNPSLVAYFCSVPVSNSTNSSYEDTNSFLGTDFNKSNYCSQSGFCTINLGELGGGGVHGLLETHRGQNSDLISNGIWFFGPEYDFYYFGSGFLMNANNYVDPDTKERVNTLFMESSYSDSEYYNDQDTNLPQQPKATFVYIHPPPDRYNESYYIFETWDEHTKYTNDSNTLTPYSPWGAMATIVSYTDTRSVTSRRYSFKNYFTYGNINLGGGGSQVSSYDSHNWLGNDDPNKYNNFRQIYTIRSDKNNVFFQFYFHHWIMKYRSSTDTFNGTHTHTESHGYDPPSWAFHAQCEFVLDALNNNPLDPNSYIKNQEEEKQLEFYDVAKPFDPDVDPGDFEFRTPELEVKIEELIDKVYETAAIDSGDPLYMIFRAYIIEGSDDLPKEVQV